MSPASSRPSGARSPRRRLVRVVICFLTDFGLQDDFVGTCHGVIARIAPDARVIDVTHGIPPTQVLQGALVLSSTLPYMNVRESRSTRASRRRFAASPAA